MMAADLSVAQRMLQYDTQYIHYTMAFRWLSTIGRNSAWGSELSQITPLTSKLNNKRHNFGLRGYL